SVHDPPSAVRVAEIPDHLVPAVSTPHEPERWHPVFVLDSHWPVFELPDDAARRTLAAIAPRWRADRLAGRPKECSSRRSFADSRKILTSFFWHNNVSGGAPTVRERPPQNAVGFISPTTAAAGRNQA